HRRRPGHRHYFRARLTGLTNFCRWLSSALANAWDTAVEARVYAAEQLEIQPGISAVVFVPPGQAELDATVLDLAAVLDGLVFDNFEIVVVEAVANQQISDAVAELRIRFPQLPLRLLEGGHLDHAAA